ncbi:unnamed protein product [Closterium sp. NIES-54]
MARNATITQSTPTGEPAAKKLCSEGQPSAAGASGVASASHSAPPPIPRASSSGSSAATGPTPVCAPAPSAPRPAPVSWSWPALPEPEPEPVAAGLATGLALNIRYRNLRRHCTTVGTVLQAMTRNTQSLVDIIFSESSAEEVRAAVLARIASLINGQAFNGVIPSFVAVAGEALRLPRRTYSKHSYSWPSANDARIFHSLFPITVRLSNNRAMEVKVFTDPNEEFTTARARGDTHLVLRNVPLGYSPERLCSTLLAGRTDSGLPWLADLRLFHRLKDPYDESAYSQLLGLPVAVDDDAGFDRCLIGQQPAPAAFKKDPGLLLIGVDLDVEVWTCAICEFECGLALDSAMYHLNSELHRKHLQESAHLPATKDKYGAWRVTTLLQHPRIAAFLHYMLPLMAGLLSVLGWLSSYCSCFIAHSLAMPSRCIPCQRVKLHWRGFPPAQ